MHVELIDSMGSDNSVCQAARVSTGNDVAGYKESKGLLNYLWREGHTSPFEHVTATFRVEVPIFIARQIMRHRTFCLAGDNVISFSRPDNGGHYPYELSRLYKNWNDPAQRARLKSMRIRSVNEESGEIVHNTITDVIYSGEKEIFALELSNGSIVRGSKDHRIYTSNGWKTIEQLREVPHSVMVQDSHNVEGFVPQEIVAGESTEWRNIPGWEGDYKVSNSGEVRSYKRAHIHGKPHTLKQTVNTQGYSCVSLSRNGKSYMHNVHSLVASAFLGPLPNGQEVRHLDGNRLNNLVDNLKYGTHKENQGDRLKHGTWKRLHTSYSDIVSIVSEGVEETYDISVEAPHHNFFANGVVVHNSYNEISGRYSELEPKFWVPVGDRPLENKGSGAHPDLQQHEDHDEKMDQVYLALTNISSRAVDSYNELVGGSVATEVARAVLPLNTYTSFYMTGNLKNFLDFIDKRIVQNAQEEVRDVAQYMAQALDNIVPVTMEVWKENR